MRRMWAGVSLCAAVLLMAGCGSSGSSGNSSSSSGSTTGVAAAESTSASASASSGGGSGITPPGTKLSVGQTATVPLQSPSASPSAPPRYKVQVTVESITKASLSDFKGIQLDATEKASTPYYVHFKVTNVGSGDIGTDAEAAISGVDNTGQDATSVTFIGTFPPCNDATAPKPFTHGKTWSTCQVYLVPGGITGADYSGFVERYIASPVRWK
jgi:hypothetical protein